MGVSSRQRMILNILLTEEQEITIKDIADRIEVSTRTVHRELTELEPLLEQQGLQLVKRSGIGVAIEGEARQKEELRLSLYNQTTVEYAPDERKLLILCQLLEATEPVKLVSLAFDLKVTTATISYDLDEMVDWLRRYDLTLLRKRGYGVELCGSESAKRKAMSELITEHLDEFELLGILKENIHGKSTRHINTVSERLLGLIEKEKLIMIENSLRTLEEELPYPLADSSFIGLVIHLALAIERIEKGEQITFDEEHLKELELTSEFRIAETIIQRLRSIFQMDIPDSEIGYITMHLRGAKLRSSYDDWFEFKNLELVTKVNRMIRYCEEQLDVSFQADPNLVQGLLTHIEPALFRIQKNMKIRNPLLTEIKARYSDLFQVLKQAVAEVFDELTVPEEEIGYLVMHIGASLERMGQFNQKFRALVVCSSGIGSSKILASRIEKELPYIGLAKNISLFDINKIPETEYDLIISTVPLSLQRDDYVLVTPLLTKEDVHNINVFLKGIRKGPLQPDASNVLNTEEVLSDLRGWQAYIGHTLSIIENFRFDTVLNQNMHIEEVLEAICRKLEQLQVIRDKEEVIEKLLERQRLGGLGIPNMRLALFHAKTEAVLRPAARLYLLDNPLLIKGMDKKYLDVDRILLLLAPARISKEGLEVLSEVSSLLIEDELAPILESGNQQRIIAFFTTHLYKYVLAKIKKER